MKSAGLRLLPFLLVSLLVTRTVRVPLRLPSKALANTTTATAAASTTSATATSATTAGRGQRLRVQGRRCCMLAWLRTKGLEAI